jgi:hypothetical protein
VNDKSAGVGGGDGDVEQLNRVQMLAKNKLETLPQAQLAFSVGGTRIVVRDIVRKVIGAVLKFKDVISAVISAEPFAALAWSGIIAILPLLENSYQQDEHAADGLHNIVFLLIRYGAMEEGFLSPEFRASSEPGSGRELLLAVQTKVVSVYAQVYVYQMRFVLQYARGKLHRALRNTFSADDWKQMWADIECTSRLIDQGVDDRIGHRTLETWGAVNDIMKSTEDIKISQQAILASVQVTTLLSCVREPPSTSVIICFTLTKGT